MLFLWDCVRTITPPTEPKKRLKIEDSEWWALTFYIKYNATQAGSQRVWVVACLNLMVSLRASEVLWSFNVPSRSMSSWLVGDGVWQLMNYLLNGGDWNSPIWNCIRQQTRPRCWIEFGGKYHIKSPKYSLLFVSALFKFFILLKDLDTYVGGQIRSCELISTYIICITKSLFPNKP